MWEKWVNRLSGELKEFAGAIAVKRAESTVLLSPFGIEIRGHRWGVCTCSLVSCHCNSLNYKCILMGSWLMPEMKEGLMSANGFCG